VQERGRERKKRDVAVPRLTAGSIANIAISLGLEAVFRPK
jgi:hypothetical protein